MKKAEKKLEELIKIRIKQYGDIFIHQLTQDEKKIIEYVLIKKGLLNYPEIMCNRISILQELKFI